MSYKYLKRKFQPLELKVAIINLINPVNTIAIIDYKNSTKLEMIEYFYRLFILDNKEVNSIF